MPFAATVSAAGAVTRIVKVALSLGWSLQGKNPFAPTGSLADEDPAGGRLPADGAGCARIGNRLGRAGVRDRGVERRAGRDRLLRGDRELVVDVGEGRRGTVDLGGRDGETR